MHQDNTLDLSSLASFERLENLLSARRRDGSTESMMTFEAFEVELGHAVRCLENDLKAADLARYDVDAEAVRVDGQEWRKCLSNQPKTYLSASGPITVSRNLYRPARCPFRKSCASASPSGSRGAACCAPTVAGRVFMKRTSSGGKSICPLELGAGIIGGLHTSVLARQVGLSIAKVSCAATSVAKWLKQAIFPGFGGQTLPKMVSGSI